MECDELWSYVGNKKNKQWVWLSMDRDTREIVGVYVGDLSAESAQALWNSLPAIYRQLLLVTPIFGMLMQLFFHQ